MNLKKSTTSELQVFSSRLFSYYEQLKQLHQHIGSLPGKFSEVFANDTDILEKELGVVGGAMQIIQEEISKRMEDKLDLKLADLEVMRIMEKVNNLNAQLHQANTEQHRTESNMKVVPNA